MEMISKFFEMKMYPMKQSTRTSTYVIVVSLYFLIETSVRNYEELRAKEILTEAEKRANAIQANQNRIVKEAFHLFNKKLDLQEAIIDESEDRIDQLKRSYDLCTKGEQWKIKRNLTKHFKIIEVAEATFEDEEDKEGLIRSVTKKLLKVYEKQRVSEATDPILVHKHEKVCENNDIQSYDCQNIINGI